MQEISFGDTLVKDEFILHRSKYPNKTTAKQLGSTMMKLFTYLPLSCFSSLCVAGTNTGMQADETGWLSPQRKELTKGSPKLVQHFCL